MQKALLLKWHVINDRYLNGSISFYTPTLCETYRLKTIFHSSIFMWSFLPQITPTLTFPSHTKKEIRVVQELCSDSADRIQCGRFSSCQKMDLRSPRRDTALLCGFCVTLKSRTNYLPGMWCRMNVLVLSCVILVPSKLNNGCNIFNLLWILMGIFDSIY